MKKKLKSTLRFFDIGQNKFIILRNQLIYSIYAKILNTKY